MWNCGNYIHVLNYNYPCYLWLYTYHALLVFDTDALQLGML